MAINAISDAYLVVDSPDCAFFKAEHIHGTHDLLSTLLDEGGHHRIINTRADVGNIVDDRRAVVRGILRDVYTDPTTGIVGLCSMPMATVTGVEYSLLVREVEEEIDLDKPAMEIPSASLHSDWVHGYEETLLQVAEKIRLPEAPRRDDTVAIVGYLMDRTEADHTANVDELRRLLAALGLRTSSVWLDGGSTASLAAVAEAGTILSLPYGREAAAVLAKRTGARQLDLDLPFGLEATERFVRAVAAAFGRDARASALHEAEMPRVARALEWLIPHALLGKKLVVAAEPFTAKGLADVAAEVGARVISTIMTAKEGHLDDGELARCGEVCFEPPSSKLAALVREGFDHADGADLLVSNAKLIDRIGDQDIPFLEFGFPSYFTHAVHDAPFLGYRGFLWVVGALANRLTLCEAMGVGRRRAKRVRDDAAE